MVPPKLHTYTVVPSLPTRLAPLKELAYNLRWSWDHPTRQLFETIDPELWRATEHNPARLLGLVAQTRLTELENDGAFTAQLDTVHADFQSYMSDGGWWSRHYADEFGPDFKIGYFSAEFGIAECLPIYSGGLGILSGDHLKSASDMNVPLVAVGLMYRFGYFRQKIAHDGWQTENYLDSFDSELALLPVLNDPRRSCAPWSKCWCSPAGG